MAKSGRPPSLKPDEKTLNLVEGLGKIQATTRECAALLRVSHPTFLKFKKRRVVEEAYERGSQAGLVSLRRNQFKAADKGNTTMLIWLGKQYLDQADKNEHSGPGGTPIQTETTVNIVSVPRGAFVPAPENPYKGADDAPDDAA